MAWKSFAASCLLSLSLSPAFADPAGHYLVRGTNPDDGQDYNGTVQVTRNGETYKVIWNIAGTEFIGTGLGAKFNGERFEMGPASADDTALSVGYVSGSSFGTAMYFRQPDGHWQGIWTYGGSSKAAAENWFPE